MDTKTDGMIPECGDLTFLAKHNVLVGAKQIRKALDKGAAIFVFLARNADPAITGPIEAKCIAHQISCAWVASMADLGKACGIDVGAAAAAAVK
jgi:large subunit ribosomal protein L7A